MLSVRSCWPILYCNCKILDCACYKNILLQSNHQFLFILSNYRYPQDVKLFYSILQCYRSSEHFLRRLASRECRKNAGIPSWRRRQCGSVAETWHDSLNRRRKPVMTVWIGGRDSDMAVSLNGWWPKPYMTVWLGGETHMGFRDGFRPISYAAIPYTASPRPRKALTWPRFEEWLTML